MCIVPSIRALSLPYFNFSSIISPVNYTVNQVKTAQNNHLLYPFKGCHIFNKIFFVNSIKHDFFLRDGLACPSVTHSVRPSVVIEGCNRVEKYYFGLKLSNTALQKNLSKIRISLLDFGSSFTHIHLECRLLALFIFLNHIIVNMYVCLSVCLLFSLSVFFTICPCGQFVIVTLRRF